MLSRSRRSRIRLSSVKRRSFKRYVAFIICCLFFGLVTACDNNWVVSEQSFNRDTTLNIIPITQINGTSETLTHIGVNFQFIAVDQRDGKYNDVTDQVTWHSSHPEIATVKLGQALGVSAGNSDIYARFGPRSSNQIELRVSDSPIKTLQINTRKIDSPTGSLLNKAPVKAKQNLRAIASYHDNTSVDVTSQVNWNNPATFSSPQHVSAPKPATIIVTNGTAQMLTTGEASVHASFMAQPSNPLPFTVSDAALKTLTISPSASTIAQNSHQQFTAIAVYSSTVGSQNLTTQDVTQHVVWHSENKEVASINLGEADALTVGNSIITASLGDMTSNPASFRVINATLSQLQITPSEPVLNLGQEMFYKAKAIYEDGSTADISEQVLWESSEPDVTNVVAAYAKGYNVGQTQINATYQGKTSNMSTLTVLDRQLVKLQLTPLVINMAKGTQTPFNVMATYDDGATVNVTDKVSVQTDVPDFVFIDDGELSAMTIGNASIYAFFDQHISNTVTLNIIDSTVQSLQITPAFETVPINGTVDYEAQATFENLDASIIITQDVSHLVAWNSQSHEIATLINETATGINHGDTVINATLDESVATVNLIVDDKTLTKLQVTPAEQSLPEGLLSQYTAIATYEDHSSRDLTALVNWSSSDNNVATLYGGEVEAVSPGEVTIRAKYLTIISNQAKLTVNNIQLRSISVTPALEEIQVGTTVPYQALGIYSDHSSQDITDLAHWGTDTEIATVVQPERALLAMPRVDLQQPRTQKTQEKQKTPFALAPFALVAGVTEGETTISARLDGIESNKAILTINAAELEHLQLTPATIDVANGSEVQYQVVAYFADKTSLDVTRFVQWKNTTPTVATMRKGQAVAIKKGETTFTAIFVHETGNNVINTVSSNDVTLSVSPKIIKSIQVTPAVQTVPLGVEQQYTAVAIYSNGSVQDITHQAAWHSSNTELATVVDGLAATLAQSDTDTYISASIGNTITREGTINHIESNKAALRIRNKTVTKLQLTPAHINLTSGSSKPLAVQATYTDGSTHDVTHNVIWELSNNDVAAIDPEQATITALKEGHANLNARWERNNNISNPVTITVSSDKITSLYITPPSQDIFVGNTAKFQALGVYDDNTVQDFTDAVDWSSSDPKIATVLNGQVLGVKSSDENIQISASYNDADSDRNIDAKMASVSIKVNALKSITVMPTTQTMAKGTTQQFTATGHYSDNTEVDITTDNGTSWRVDSDNLTIDENGLATAINKSNNINVFATKNTKIAENEIIGKATINVTAAIPEALTISSFLPESSRTLTVGSKLKLKAEVTMEGGAKQDVSELAHWNEDSNSVCITLEKAVITAVAPCKMTNISAMYQGIPAENSINIATIETQNRSCNIPQITDVDHDGTSLTFWCPATTEEFPTSTFITSMGLMAPAGMKMPLVSWQEAERYCKKNQTRLPTKKELYALIAHVNKPDNKGWGLYLNYGWPMFINYWTQTEIGNKYWTVNMLTGYSWPAEPNSRKIYSAACVKETKNIGDTSQFSLSNSDITPTNEAKSLNISAFQHRQF